MEYVEVTEISGDSVSREQIQRMYTRYHFARQFCDGKDVLEVACGSGQGLGYLAKKARMVVGGDYSVALLKMAQSHYRGRIPLVRLDGHALPFTEKSFDVVILYEAIYYLEKPESFIEECMRVLRPGGVVLICNPNKDLPDFNPSPYSYRYFAPCDFMNLLTPYGLRSECYGDCKVDYGSLKQRIFSLLKKTMVNLHLMPKTMAGKKVFKRIVFGKLVPMPPELTDEKSNYPLPSPLDPCKPDKCHKVIFALAKKLK